MKRSLLSVLMLVCLTSQAAPAPAPVVTPDLVGAWRSDEHNDVIGAGTMQFTRDGKATLSPDGFDALKGTYVVAGPFIDITTKQGKASLAYKLKGSMLTIEYQEGQVQHFTRVVPGKATPAAVAASKGVKK